MNPAPFQIRQLDHIVLRVSNVAAMMRFYIDVISCTLERVEEEIGLYQLRAGNSLVDLIAVEGKLGRAGGAAPGTKGRNLDHFCLRIEPFDETRLREHLAAHGVKVGEVGSRYGADGQGPSLYLADPEGNTVELKGPPAA